jgi:D-serine deaminase-like pyridoxal phosphate-dependent protein
LDNYKTFDRIETPSVIIEMEKVRRNISSMAQDISEKGCFLRPHIKTHKIPELARMQIDAGACGITCAKLSEARVMADAGIADIFIAYPVIGKDKITRALELNKKIRLILGVDSIQGATALSEAAQAAGTVFEVRLEIDTGLRRTGIAPHKAAEMASLISSMQGLSFGGIYTFRGSVYDGKPTTDTAAAGNQEGTILVEVKRNIERMSIKVRDVSAGSTPTARFVAAVDGVTEVRPGTYIFNDMMQANIGAATIDDCAAMLLVTVISTPSPDLAIIDGGSKTFAADAKMGAVPFYLEGYGRILGYEGLILERLTEEHGMIVSGSGETGLEIGQRLCIIPNHICTTINLHDHVYFLEVDGSLRRVKVAARGKLY